MEARKKTLSEQIELFHMGENYEAYKVFGAHPRTFDGVEGVIFRVWAPHAQAVSLVGDFNQWQVGATPMKTTLDGCWDVFVPGLQEYDLYKFAVTQQDGTVKFKADPYAFHAETDGATASKIYFLEDRFKWSDEKFMENRAQQNFLEMPMNIYEVNLASWKQYENGKLWDYGKLADELIPYVKNMGYTHIEVMPLTEFPYPGSWGYQPTGYFAITSRFGTPEGFAGFVNKAHRAGIGVIMDWVPAHFPKDDWGLATFDGTYLYEDPDPLRREHRGWGTVAFDYAKQEVQSFLVSSAMLFLKEYHVDGLRVDAVAAMLYLDYDREEWRPNSEGGTENMEARSFLQKLNHAVGTEVPGALMIAEESTAWPMVTQPTNIGGLGFHLKWNMGWMNDSLAYVKTDPYFRKGMHEKLTFPMVYAFSENYVLPISHDEVVHGKGSLLNKFPGDYEQKFAGFRGFLMYMLAEPGKKLMFMGSEFGQFIEWNYQQGLDWVLLDYEAHRKLQDYVRDANHFYLKHKQMWEQDHDWNGFQWISADDRERNIISFRRIAKDGKELIFVINFAPVCRMKYRIIVPKNKDYKEIMNSDDVKYGGSGILNPGKLKPIRDSKTQRHIEITLPPLAAVVIQ